MRAIVFAHDRATTLDPFTVTRPRALIPVLTKPVLGHVLAQLVTAGIRDITMVTGHLGERVEEYVGDGAAFGAAITPVRVASAADFAAALAEQLAAARGPLALIDGGTFMEAGLLAAAFAAGKPGAAVTDHTATLVLAVNTNPLYHPRARLGTDGEIAALQPVAIDEIKGAEQSPLGDMAAGCLVLGSGRARELAAHATRRAPEDFDAVVDMVIGAGRSLGAAPAPQRFVTLRFPWEILGASFLGLQLEFGTAAAPVRHIAPSARVHPNAILKNTVVVEADAVVESGAVLDNVKVGAETVINEHAYVKQSILGPRCRIGPLAYVHGSVCGPKTKIGTPNEFSLAVAFGHAGYGHHGHAGMGVYGEGSGLMAGAIVTANRGEPTKVKIHGRLVDSGWFNIGAFVGDNCRLNAGVTVMPGRKIGPHAVIGPGIVVYRDVAPNTRLVLKQELSVETRANPDSPWR